jgi:hypothetical protein
VVLQGIVGLVVVVVAKKSKRCFRKSKTCFFVKAKQNLLFESKNCFFFLKFSKIFLFKTGLKHVNRVGWGVINLKVIFSRVKFYLKLKVKI